MPRSIRHHTMAATALALAVTLASAAPVGATDLRHPTPATAHTHITAAYELPGDRVYPEGIAAAPRTGELYVGSYTNGTIYRITPRHRTAEVFLPAGTDGRHTANGLKVDGAGRLWVTDSTAGVAVYDIRSRRLLARFDVPGDSASFVNDVTIAPDGSAYLTDSVRTVVYRVTPGELARTAAGDRRGTLTTRFDLSGTVGPHPAGTFTLNGIVADPSGRYLLTPDMTGGDLFRIDLASGTARRVTLHGGDMRHADGLELRHGTLWAAHNTTNTITRWHLTDDGRTARMERRVTDEALQIPTTLVRQNGRTLVVRSQFDKGGPMGPGTPETPFTVAAVRGI
ncbi:SMP-30/gluconolactonase/LRE family protein [Streptomyces spiramyceticus]|uniref:SMP-30/gluconolactonase/LRE family protein n=1 Tax=Streptomyces spiramyceticus TaxID=299717 RepID=UPI00237C18EB|nr:SMP-30/gluconolactonase/LRE family protein [Streptomyces spiramyceticus]